MESNDNMTGKPEKKNKDFIWLLIGGIGLVAVLVLLKVGMRYFGLIG